MTTFDEIHALHNPGFFTRVRRDVIVLAQLTRMLWIWFRVARKVRARYRVMEAKGEVYWLDDVSRGYEGRR